jgi:hypothetical protein
MPRTFLMAIAIIKVRGKKTFLDPITSNTTFEFGNKLLPDYSKLLFSLRYELPFHLLLLQFIVNKSYSKLLFSLSCIFANHRDGTLKPLDSHLLLSLNRFLHLHRKLFQSTSARSINFDWLLSLRTVFRLQATSRCLVLHYNTNGCWTFNVHRLFKLV